MLIIPAMLLALMAEPGMHPITPDCQKMETDSQRVSMVQLIARPEHFDGRGVRVIGFVVKTSRLYYLYVDEGAAFRNDSANAVIIATVGDYFELRTDGIEFAKLPMEIESRSYRQIEGVFKLKNGTSYFGSVCSVDPVNSAPPEAE